MTNLSNRINYDRLFRRLALLTVLSIYLLILAGGIVRGTGSGMGCPDWPKCFGQWIPPTDVSQLPVNYQEIYAHRGYNDTTFNATKTWIEYLNRLLGVLTGFFVFGTLLASILYIRRKPIIPTISFVAFVLVGVQGWLGSKVVSNLLAPWLVTLHMLLALIIVGLLLFLTATSYRSSVNSLANFHPVDGRIKVFLWISSFALLLQILLGTQVREAVDEVARQLGEGMRDQWIGHLGTVFIIHRSSSWIVLISVIAWAGMALRLPEMHVIRRLAIWTLGLTVAEIGVGVVMAYLAIPRYAQPIHLFIAVILLGIQFVSLLLITGREHHSSRQALETFSH
jgi:heme a synthase